MVKNPLLISGICLIICLVFIFILIWPKYQDLNILRKKIKGKEIELESEVSYFSDLQKISQELQKYQTPLSKIDQALPKTSLLPEILNFIQRTSSQSGLLLKEISPVSVGVEVKDTETKKEILEEGTAPAPLEVKKSQIKETKINLDLIGDYSSFKNFLSVLEQSARLFEVEKASLSSTSRAEAKGGEEGLPSSTKEGAKFDLVIKTYSY